MADLDENMQSLYQTIGGLEDKIAKMTVRLSAGGLDTLALRVARLVEDQFAMHHMGGRTQRLAKIQVIIREAMREIATGERDWRAWSPNGFTAPPDEPEPGNG